jgi:hypothetical protein
MVSRLMLLVHSFSPKSGITRMPIRFTYRIFPSLKSFKVDVSSNDILFNDIDQASLSLGLGRVPWHGPQEKGFMCMSTLIWACCVYGGLIVDVTMKTCKILLYFSYVLYIFLVLVNLYHNHVKTDHQ